MTVYKGNDQIENIYKGGNNIAFIFKGGTLVFGSPTIFESSTAGSYQVSLPISGTYQVICVGGGGAAYMRGVYDNKGYLATGGSGGAFVGTFNIPAGVYNVVVGQVVNNTTPQTSNTQTSAPSDYTAYGSSISNVVSVGGGGTATATTSAGVGAAGTAPVFTIQPLTTTISSAGNPGNYTSGGKGSAAAAVAQGGASLYGGYGAGQGGATSEYASKRYWIDGTGGYVKIQFMGA